MRDKKTVGSGCRLWAVAIQILSFLVLVAPLEAAAREPGWYTYRNQAFGYQVEYPAGWKVLEATRRTSDSATWAGSILIEDEVQKVTFLEHEYEMWQGEFEVRVLENAKHRSLDAWAKNYEVQDVSGGSLIEAVEEAALGGRPAKRFKLFLFDHQGIQIVGFHRGRIYQLGFAGENSNDPNLKKHQAIYERMTAGFRFLEPEASRPQ